MEFCSKPTRVVSEVLEKYLRNMMVIYRLKETIGELENTWFKKK